MALESSSQESRLEAIMPTLFRDALSKAERRLLRVAPECQVSPCGPAADLRFVNISMVYLAGSITKGVDAVRIQVRGWPL
jgi:hypothetical protein